MRPKSRRVARKVGLLADISPQGHFLRWRSLIRTIRFPCRSPPHRPHRPPLGFKLAMAAGATGAKYRSDSLGFPVAKGRGLSPGPRRKRLLFLAVPRARSPEVGHR